MEIKVIFGILIIYAIYYGANILMDLYKTDQSSNKNEEEYVFGDGWNEDEVLASSVYQNESSVKRTFN